MATGNTSTTEEATPAIATDAQRVKLPGFGLPRSFGLGDEDFKFFQALESDDRGKLGKGLTRREQRMLDFMDKVTDEPGWERQVYDEKMCIKELREKAARLAETGFVTTLNSEVTVAKSDSAVSAYLLDSIRQCVAHLEAVSVWEGGYQLGSDQQALDLLDPSLFPVVFGLTRALPYGAVPLYDCAAYTGCGDLTVDEPIKQEESETERPKRQSKYQWLPSDVVISKTENGKITTAKITSYINNLHPHRHRALYSVFEQFVAAAVPLWEEVLTDWGDRRRIKLITTDDDKDFYMPKGKVYRPPRGRGKRSRDEDDSDDDPMWSDHYENWELRHRALKFREPHQFEPSADRLAATKRVNLRTDGHSPTFSKGLQVIFKLTTIHLTPEKPDYTSADWQIDGTLSERICATALYYYDEDNIKPSFLAFRQCVDEDEVGGLAIQGTYHSLEKYTGLYNRQVAVQDLGRIQTRFNRLLVYPNVLQQSAGSFSLRDPSRPGYRKILTMYLIDPNRRVLSSANVPPQRRDWWSERVLGTTALSRLPNESFAHVIDLVDTFPLSPEKALAIRADLKMQHKALAQEQQQRIDKHTFQFSDF
ncbi:hypothetical protein SEPCBS57363_006677 [Sporothrix epigloea]|uniref:DUF4246 domain-containing protein n=1 Tax=Sporothrix epigloea TaxID=1892477 RepID=A0ABP0E4C8_9PEZI